jgi:hypothetical protein
MKWLRRRWGAIWRWLLRRPTPLAVLMVEELPDELDAKSLYVVGEGGYRWYAAMLCPCGCGATLHMNLLPESRPRWRLTEHRDGTATLHPSVWRTKDCRSHFFVRRGLIDWCRDAD